VQHCPAPQSPSPQHAAVVHDPPQHFRPEPHCASAVHPQLLAEHCRVVPSQHWLARQSAALVQHVKHVPLAEQHFPAPHCASLQHCAEVHVPSQHSLPAPHSASRVQLHDEVPHCLVAVLQHVPARQSAFDRHPARHAPPAHTCPAAQSASSQHCTALQVPPQHF